MQWNLIGWFFKGGIVRAIVNLGGTYACGPTSWDRKRKGYYGQANGNGKSKTHCGSIGCGRKGRDCSIIGWGYYLPCSA